MDNPKTQFGRNVRRLREALGLTQEALGAAAGLDRSYVGGVERGERNPSLSTIAQLARALQTSVAILFSGPDEQLPASRSDNGVVAFESDGQLTVRFKYDQHDAQYVLDGTRSEFDEVLNVMRSGLAEPGSSADAVAAAFIVATSQWPNANPSDLWTFLIRRIYCDPANHPPANARLNLEQSWKRTSGWALERVFVRHYMSALQPHGIVLKIGTKAEKESFLGTISDPFLIPDKADILVTHQPDRSEELLGVVHVKASIAERRTDDVPMSQALIQAGYLSIFCTMDCKSFPSANPVNRGEFGDAANASHSEKRRDFEEYGHFSACFSYNSNTVPTMSKGAVARIRICDFRDPDDDFVRFLRAHSANR